MYSTRFMSPLGPTLASGWECEAEPLACSTYMAKAVGRNYDQTNFVATVLFIAWILTG